MVQILYAAGVLSTSTVPSTIEEEKEVQICILSPLFQWQWPESPPVFLHLNWNPKESPAPMGFRAGLLTFSLPLPGWLLPATDQGKAWALGGEAGPTEFMVVFLAFDFNIKMRQRIPPAMESTYLSARKGPPFCSVASLCNSGSEAQQSVHSAHSRRRQGQKQADVMCWGGRPGWAGRVWVP